MGDSSLLQTEFEFTLPQGYVDDEGDVHKEGRMRLATAADEIEPLQNPRVQSNSSYLTIVLLSRVVTELGDLDGEEISPSVIESLFVSDLEYLQAMYERVNNQGTNSVRTACPECGREFDVDAETGSILDAGAGHAHGGGGAGPGTADMEVSEAGAPGGAAGPGTGGAPAPGGAGGGPSPSGGAGGGSSPPGTEASGGEGPGAGGGEAPAPGDLPDPGDPDSDGPPGEAPGPSEEAGGGSEDAEGEERASSETEVVETPLDPGESPGNPQE